MKRIIKGPEPNSLTEYRNTEFASYKDLPKDVKEAVRTQLLKEQGYICCYCLTRIPERRAPQNKQMKIEHHLPESGETKQFELTYSNLYAACNGSEGKPYKEQHCDTRKGQNKLTLNPSNANIEDQFRYKTNGFIEAVNPEKQDEIDVILNLNNDILVRNRVYAIDGTRERLKRLKAKGLWSNQILDKEIQKLRTKKDGKYVPFCMAMIQFLEGKKR